MPKFMRNDEPLDDLGKITVDRDHFDPGSVGKKTFPRFRMSSHRMGIDDDTHPFTELINILCPVPGLQFPDDL
jgi:hypothetical protein